MVLWTPKRLMWMSYFFVCKYISWQECFSKIVRKLEIRYSSNIDKLNYIVWTGPYYFNKSFPVHFCNIFLNQACISYFYELQNVIAVCPLWSKRIKHNKIQMITISIMKNSKHWRKNRVTTWITTLCASPPRLTKILEFCADSTPREQILQKKKINKWLDGLNTCIPHMDRTVYEPLAHRTSCVFPLTIMYFAWKL